MKIEQISELLEKTAAHIEMLENENNMLRKKLEESVSAVNLNKEASFDFSDVVNNDYDSLGQPSNYSPSNQLSSGQKLEEFLNNL